MKDPIEFDVVVTYSDYDATSADKPGKNEKPFSSESQRQNYNQVYAYFLKSCQKKGLSSAFTTSADIIGAGTFKSYWLFENNHWQKIRKTCYSRNIFDKFSPTNKLQKTRRKLLFSSSDIIPFNSDDLLFFTDKLKTYKNLQSISIPTVFIETAAKTDIIQAIKNLDKLVLSHPHRQDFTAGYILKDRLGSGGDKIYKLTQNFVTQIQKILKKEINISFILQPFVNFAQGYKFKGKLAPTDIRLIYMDGNIVQSYLRTAKTGDFRCNQHQGGTLEYIDTDQIKPGVLKASREIVDFIDSRNALYALDFIVSDDGNPYFLEGNYGPGLSWEGKTDEKKAKQLTGIIINELSRRVNKFAAAKTLV